MQTKAGYVLVYQRRGSDRGAGGASASSSVDKVYSAGSSQDTDMVDDTYSSTGYNAQHMDVN